MITWGINALNHDASIAVVNNGQLVYWKRSSEYSGITGDDKLHSCMLKECYDIGIPNNIVWYERPWLKKTRQAYAGQWRWVFDMQEIPRRYLKSINVPNYPISYLPHHLSHAAAGFLTSPFEEATIVVLDAMGEWESASIWNGRGTSLKKFWSRSYPTSLGLFYSAFTDLIGLKPLGEEHVLQQLSEKGDPDRYYRLVDSYWKDNWITKKNLHKGVRDWPRNIDSWGTDREDIAAAVQKVFEEKAKKVMDIAKYIGGSNNLVYMGGCAMNSKFNKTLQDGWKGIWSLPIPGDAASSIGAALYHQQSRITWDLGYPKQILTKWQIKNTQTENNGS